MNKNQSHARVRTAQAAAQHNDYRLSIQALLSHAMLASTTLLMIGVLYGY